MNKFLIIDKILKSVKEAREINKAVSKMDYVDYPQMTSVDIDANRLLDNMKSKLNNKISEIKFLQREIGISEKN